MRTLPLTGASERELHMAVRELIEGRSNATGKVTLRPGQTTTVVESNTINANAGVWLQAMTASAAAASPHVVVVPGGGSFVITHDANAATNRTFYYLVNGG